MTDSRPNPPPPGDRENAEYTEQTKRAKDAERTDTTRGRSRVTGSFPAQPPGTGSSSARSPATGSFPAGAAAAPPPAAPPPAAPSPAAPSPAAPPAAAAPRPASSPPRPASAPPRAGTGPVSTPPRTGAYPASGPPAGQPRSAPPAGQPGGVRYPPPGGYGGAAAAGMAEQPTVSLAGRQAATPAPPRHGPPAAPVSGPSGTGGPPAWAPQSGVSTARSGEITGEHERVTATALATGATATRTAGAATATAAQAARAAAASRAAPASAPPIRPEPAPRPAAAVPARPTGPRGFRPRRRPGAVGAVSLGQVFCWVVAISAVAATIDQPVPVLVGAAGGAASLLILTATRIRHRWLYQAIGTWLRFQFRRRRAELTTHPDMRVGLLQFLAPGAEVAEVDSEAGMVGVIGHPGGVVVLLEPVASDADLLAEEPVSLPSVGSLLPVSDPDGPPTTVQVVVSVVPAPALTAEPTAAGMSYGQFTGGRVPASRQAWVALQLQRTAGDHAEEDLREALVGVARRLRRKLERDGLSVRLLDRDEVLAAVGQASAALGDASRAKERWRSWWLGQVPQTCLQIRKWPDLETAKGAALFDRISAVPSLATTIAVAARRAGDRMETQAVIRVAAPTSGQLSQAVSGVSAAAGECGAALQVLSGEQGSGVAASLPLGGFLP